MSASCSPESPRSPFSVLGETLDQLADLPEQIRAIQRSLRAGTVPERRLLTVKEAAAQFIFGGCTMTIDIDRSDSRAEGPDPSVEIEWGGHKGTIWHAGYVVYCALLDQDRCLRGEGSAAESEKEAAADFKRKGWRQGRTLGWVCPECEKLLEGGA